MVTEPSWTLLDAVAHAAANPRSFFLPDAEERAGLQPGDLAKLVFTVQAPGDDESDAGGERMWVEVTDRAPDGYVGRLGNVPMLVTDLAEGARVEFEPRHVVQLPATEPDPWKGRVAFVSARVFDDDDPGVHVATFDAGDAGRAVADDRQLSGWSLLAGDETAEDIDDPERIRLPSLPWMMERHPELRAVLDGHDGSEGTWLRDGDGWRRA